MYNDIKSLILNKEYDLHITYGLLIIVSLFCFSNCARQVAPTGGPPDKIPPRIFKVTPDNDSTMVPLDQQVEFEFNESMNRKTLDKAIFITPHPGDRVKYKWKGRKLRVEFQDSLKTNRTYVITLGTDLKDSHGNSLQKSYTLAFSTGTEISNGKISGKVYSDEKAQGILMWAYILEEGQDVDPEERPGDYITQTDAEGLFELSYLSEGVYRIFAIMDKDKNRFFETGLDGLGITFKDIELTKDSLAVSNINFKTTIKDTIGPALVSVSAQDRNHLVVRFDENLLNDGVEVLTNYTIRTTKTSTEDSLGINLAFLNKRDPMEIIFVTDPQIPQMEYEIEIQNLMDISKNPIDLDYNRVEFIASSIADTVKPKIISSAPEDSARSVFLDANISFNFTEAMDQNSLQHSFQLRDSSGQVLPGLFQWDTSAFVNFSPTKDLESLSSYTVEVKLDSVFDLFGNAIADSTFLSAFTTINTDTLSSISGTVIDEDSTAQGQIFLKASQTEANGQSYQIQFDVPGPYTFKDILPGTYIIEGFRDRDNNGQYSYGTAVPFHPAERFLVYPEKITIKSRWPNDGNDITFTK